MTQNEKRKGCRNVVSAIFERAVSGKRYSKSNGCLERLVEQCGAQARRDHQKINLPQRTRSTFITAFSPDQKLLASCHGDHNIHISDVNTGKFIQSLVGHERSPWCVSFHPSSNDILASGCLNGEVSKF